MSQVSISHTESFRLRAQRSEQGRTIMMLVVLGCVLMSDVVRRSVGGLVMSDNRVFVPRMAVVGATIIYELWIFALIRQSNRQGRLLPDRCWRVSAAVELAAVLGLLAISQWFSPRGEIGALLAPPLLVLPVVIMLSVLRLRPMLTLITGLAAAAGHLLLTLRAIWVVDPAANTYPVLLSYPALLGLCGAAGAVVTRAVRRYVQEGADEAAAREQANRQLETIQHELSIARDIQQGLLPSSVPNLPGYDIAGMNRPADLTGGDYYDWQPLPDGRLAIVLADVTGHGIGPAMVMAVCRAYARASAPLMPRPSDLLARLNDLVHQDVQGLRFITLAIGLLDPAASRVELSSAGHGPTLLYRAADATVEQFNGDGYPLGVVPDQAYDASRTRELRGGDVLLFMTDGFFEWQRAGDMECFGIERIENVLKEHASESAESILKQIDLAVQAFANGNPQHDDVTAVVLKRLAQP